MTTSQSHVVPGNEKPAADLLGHPRGLITLAGTELWERFSFYGLQVILAYYLYFSITDGGLGLPMTVALGVTGSYGGAIYIAQMLGSWLADRLVGARYVVLVGATMIMLGHIALAAIPAVPGLITGLVLIVLGTGGLKVNVTAMVGALYSREDTRRDSGYSIYYMGISLGAFLGPVLTGFLQSEVGFHVAFSAAAVGMALGLVQYVSGWRRLPESTRRPAKPLTAQGRRRGLLVAVVSVTAIVLMASTGVINLSNISTVTTGVIVMATLAYFGVILSSRSLSKTERNKVVAYIPVFIGTVVFWLLLLQLFTTFAVYADTRVDLSIGSFDVPAAYVITAEGLFATILAPVIAALWFKLGVRQPSSLVKIAGGLLVLAAAYAVFALAAWAEVPKVSIWIAMFGMLLFGLGEVTVAPVAMSSTTRLAPAAFPSQMMALYFLTMAAGSTLAGTVAQFYDPANEAAFFTITTVGAVAISAALLGLAPLAKRLSGER
ncbi:oligopeptide:H+ symporter [Saxibacter everestensis]|uniref:Oligopeptide:H+ symporter n=1 Tax=Saxibacter everestensis TaxID=2909229 RepID=A0ABY8QU15_9MICO|nr:oligopeptide:H+ symporter [Brevibacteriaceae bacterium ZFBP1038]